MPFVLLSFILALITSISLAHAQEKAFEDRVPEQLFTDKSFWTFTLENDLFGSGSDQNYTNGFRISYFDAGIEAPGIVHALENFIPVFDINKNTSVYYSFGQNLYTPEDITLANPPLDDRPYAAFLYGSAGLSTISDDHIDELEATIGIVGPWAFGEEVQEFVHDNILGRDPNGWDTQLENELGLMVSWQRRWPEALRQDLGPVYFRLQPHAGVTLGNIYTYAASGFTLQLTPNEYKWQSQPPRVRPSIPGTGFFDVPDETFAWNLFGGAEFRAVGQNIFLDGNTFEDSHSVDKEHLVADLSAGVALTYGRTQIAYTLNWRSKEFKTQDDPSLFGSISIGYRF